MTDPYQFDVEAIRRIDAAPKMLEIVCRTTGMGFAAVARVTDERWVACAVRDAIDFGLKPGGELEVATTLCHEIRQSGEAVVIDHVTEDAVYCGHPTPARYGFQSYISVPIVLSDGSFFGTLCAIDPRPARVNTAEAVGMFKLFAELIGFHLESAAHLESSTAVLLSERKTSELREQFIAVLGHDLRNPLAAISGGVRLLQRTALDTKASSILAQMQDSVIRMSSLINNVLDFARGRLGGGFTLERRTDSLEPVLKQVIAEFRTSYPDRAIEPIFSLNHPVSSDHSRMGQLFSNLLGNALRYGTPGTPVRVRASTGEASFSLEVANGGEAIPPETMEKLFSPFARGAAASSQQGLGLGLYIASEIAKAHGGTIAATSSPAESRFILTMPRA